MEQIIWFAIVTIALWWFTVDSSAGAEHSSHDRGRGPENPRDSEIDEVDTDLESIQQLQQD